MLFVGRIEKEKTVGEQENGPDGYDKFSLQFHNGFPRLEKFRYGGNEIRQENDVSLLISNIFYQKTIPYGNDGYFFWDNRLKK